MDQLFASLAISGASLVSKAAFSYAQGYAVKQISTFVAKTTADKSSLHAKLARLERILALKLAVVTPAIDTCEILATRGNTTLEAALELSGELRKSLKKIGDRVNAADGSVTDGRDIVGQQALTAEVLEDIEAVLTVINDLVPFLQLALQNSGASLGGNMPSSVSPSRLLQASTAVALAGGRFAAHKQFGPTQPPDPVQVGPSFPVRVYSQFQSSSRAKGLSDLTWKEDHAKASVIVQRINAGSGDASRRAYDLVILEDLNDGRFHDEDNKDTPIQTNEDGVRPGRTTRISVTDIQKLYYTRSGELLNIDAKAPVMVVKIDKEAHAPSSLVPAGNVTPLRAKEKSTAEWLAFELCQEEDGLTGSDESDISDDESSGASASPTKKLVQRPSSGTAAINPKIPIGLLSLLEYILRLCTLEVSEQRSHLETPDEKLMLYMTNELRSRTQRGDNRPGSTDLAASTTSGGPSNSARRTSSVTDSPLARKAGTGSTRFIDRLMRSGSGELGEKE
ncbi:hypothetical protein PhCBS80983_g05131 [Powellomyces hirtus]|uniref:Ran-binding-domain-containing protein n=1 Tax=Powellomyces hirtus TaxID=109895 RepID=A0A507DVZ5_9FUNG|nr:hypothetical protein PhCBS80983_g05131 [Powellomyces hirtus]